MKKHVNIPIFVPHMGCPHTCVFCNQKTISGHGKPDFSSVEREIEAALATVDTSCQDAQIAFFGGSFTGIDREDMIYLLSTAKKFIDDGRVRSVRISTRPDYIDGEIIKILKEYGVGSVELGIQSCSDDVLSVCERGHDANTSRAAGRMLAEAGFEFVGQMMIGLPGSSVADEVNTAKEIIAMGAKAARIYPTVVFRGTKLAEMAERGEYVPLTREEIITRSAAVLEEFAGAGVDVIRIGLQSSETLVSGDEIACGDYSESIGEMIISRLFRNRFAALIGDCAGKSVTAYVNPRRISCAIGHRGENKTALTDEFKLKNLKVLGDETLSEYETRITTE